MPAQGSAIKRASGTLVPPSLVTSLAIPVSASEMGFRFLQKMGFSCSWDSDGGPWTKGPRVPLSLPTHTHPNSWPENTFLQFHSFNKYLLSVNAYWHAPTNNAGKAFALTEFIFKWKGSAITGNDLRS